LILIQSATKESTTGVGVGVVVRGTKHIPRLSRKKVTRACVVLHRVLFVLSLSFACEKPRV
jgi:hypothetical protein